MMTTATIVLNGHVESRWMASGDGEGITPSSQSHLHQDHRPQGTGAVRSGSTLLTCGCCYLATSATN